MVQLPLNLVGFFVGANAFEFLGSLSGHNWQIFFNHSLYKRSGFVPCAWNWNHSQLSWGYQPQHSSLSLLVSLFQYICSCLLCALQYLILVVLPCKCAGCRRRGPQTGVISLCSSGDTDANYGARITVVVSLAAWSYLRCWCFLDLCTPLAGAVVDVLVGDIASIHIVQLSRVPPGPTLDICQRQGVPPSSTFAAMWFCCNKNCDIYETKGEINFSQTHLGVI